MNGLYKVLDSVDTGSSVLHFDADWDRGRIAVIVNERDYLLLYPLDHDRLRFRSIFGDSLFPPDGRAATNVILHPREDVAVTAGWDRPLRVWSLDPLRLIHEFGDPCPAGVTRKRHGFWGASFSACGQYVDTHNLALERGQRFNWATGGHVADRWGLSGPFIRHPGGDLLALAMGPPVVFCMWEDAIAKWCPVVIDMSVPCKLAFGPGTLAAVGGEYQIHVFVFDFPRLTPRFSVKLDMVDEDTAEEYGVSQALAFSPDGRFLYVPGADGEIVAMDAADGLEIHRWRAHDDMVTHLVHHPSEGRLISGGLDGRISLSTTAAGVPSPPTAEEVQELLRLYPPMADDPDRMPKGAVTYLDAPLP